MTTPANQDPAISPAAAGRTPAHELVPRAGWSEMQPAEHFVQLYEADEYLLDSLSGFIGAGLCAGEACVVVATAAHRTELAARLQVQGVDVAAAGARGQYIALDAAETLARFMLGAEPAPALFAEHIGALLTRAAAGGSPVRVFGEMVALLWADGHYEAALRVEELWETLRTTHTFTLFCAYPMSGFNGAALAEPLSHVCANHTRVIPAESYSALTEPDARLRAIVELQQQARSLQAEIAVRQQAEAALRAVKDELEVQVEDLRRLHEMSVNLTSTLDVETVLQEVLRAALAVQGTDLGLLSLCDPERPGLNPKVQSGFTAEFMQDFEHIPPGSGPCGACYAQRQRIVVEDVEADPLCAPYRAAARRAGFRASHSTPLLSRAGEMIGVLSVHFRTPHRPSERETRLIDLYARMAADLIEHARLHQQVQQKLSEREQLLAREQVARAEAESANRLKDEFLATVSHELRTPLNAIIGWTHMLRVGGLDTAATMRALATVERNAQAQAQLIEDILDVSRVITGQLRLDIGPVDVAAVVNAAVDAVQLAAEAKGMELCVTLDPSARHVAGDASRLQQIVWNLLANAIKFTPQGGRVEVRLARAGAEAQLSVQDSGEGIDPDFLPYIFDRFRQADASSTRQHGGLGLGLAIVRHLVELHGGTVHAASAGIGHGATFTINLPLADAPAPAPRRRRESDNSRAEQTRAKHAPPSVAGVQVLLVDDDLDTLQVVAAMLTSQGAQVQTVASAAEALTVLAWYEPNVLVSDLTMPEQDGYTLISKLRAAEATTGRHIPAVALTACVRVEERTRALAAGFNLFVPKPVTPHELLTAIADLAAPQPAHK